MAYLLELNAYAAQPKHLPEYRTQEWTSKLVVIAGEMATGHRVVGVSANDRLITDFRPRLIGPGDVPARIQLASRAKKFPPFVRGNAAMWGVREDVRVIIEHFEPGVHQFVEFELSDGNGRRADQKYFYLNITQYREVILVERSEGIELPPPKVVPGLNDDRPLITGCNVRTGAKLVASSQRIGRHHLWRSWLIPGRRIFCSDSLWQALSGAKLTRLLQATHVPECDDPWDDSNTTEQIIMAQTAFRRAAQE